MQLTTPLIVDPDVATEGTVMGMSAPDEGHNEYRLLVIVEPEKLKSQQERASLLFGLGRMAPPSDEALETLGIKRMGVHDVPPELAKDWDTAFATLRDRVMVSRSTERNGS